MGGGLRRGAEGLEKTENGLVIQPENEPETLVNMKRFQKKNLEIQPAECLSQCLWALEKLLRWAFEGSSDAFWLGRQIQVFSVPL